MLSKFVITIDPEKKNEKRKKRKADTMTLISRIYAFQSAFTLKTEINKLAEELAEACAESARLPARDSLAQRIRLVEELADVFIVATNVLDMMNRDGAHLRNKTFRQFFVEEVKRKIARTETRISEGYYDYE